MSSTNKFLRNALATVTGGTLGTIITNLPLVAVGTWTRVLTYSDGVKPLHLQDVRAYLRADTGSGGIRIYVDGILMREITPIVQGGTTNVAVLLDVIGKEVAIDMYSTGVPQVKYVSLLSVSY